MNDKVEKALNLFDNNYNCAQAVFFPFCENNEFGVDKETALKLACGFGGGLRCGEVCGAVSGAILAIGMKYGHHMEGDLKTKDFCYRKTIEFVNKFKKANQSVICRELLDIDIWSENASEEDKQKSKELHKTFCPKMIESAIEILENMEFDI